MTGREAGLRCRRVPRTRTTGKGLTARICRALNGVGLLEDVMVMDPDRYGPNRLAPAEITQCALFKEVGELGALKSRAQK